jgi:hypothetical protein
MLFMLITGQANADRAINVYNSWGQYAENLLFVTDSTEGTQHAPWAQLPFPDTLGGHRQSQRKWFHALRYASQCLMSESMQRDWLVMCDDDSYMNVHFVSEWLEDAQRTGKMSPSSDHAVGLVLRFNGPQPWLAGGACSVLSRHAVHKLAEALPTCWPSLEPGDFSDQRVSWCMQSVGIPLEDHPSFFHMFASWFESGQGKQMRPEGVPSKPFSFHYVKDHMSILAKQYYPGFEPLQITLQQIS